MLTHSLGLQITMCACDFYYHKCRSYEISQTSFEQINSSLFSLTAKHNQIFYRPSKSDHFPYLFKSGSVVILNFHCFETCKLTGSYFHHLNSCESTALEISRETLMCEDELRLPQATSSNQRQQEEPPPTPVSRRESSTHVSGGCGDLSKVQTVMTFPVARESPLT